MTVSHSTDKQFNQYKPGTGSHAVGVPRGWSIPESAMCMDKNIRVKKDNNTLLTHQSNVITNVPKHNLFDKDLLMISSTKRGNINPTVEVQTNIKSIVPNTIKPLEDKPKTTLKETVLQAYNGGAGSYIKTLTKRDLYTEGTTSFQVNKTLVNNYTPIGANVIGSEQIGNIGEVSAKKRENSKGPGTLCQAVPSRETVSTLSKFQSGKIIHNHNKNQTENKIDPLLVSGLLNNPYSVYATPNTTDIPIMVNSLPVDLCQNNFSTLF